ncbi:MAG TPA: ABC transporter substrate-binding protein [Acidimicrobiales bacterium]|nr:ABC transporter substrate-binding protein [Acidimicrobiales bacterium]
MGSGMILGRRGARSPIAAVARRCLLGGVIGAMVSLPVASFAGGTAGAASFPTSHTLNLSFLEDPGQPPDPDVYYAGEGLLLTRNMYQGLLQYKTGTAKRVLEPELATSWSVSKNGLVYTFQLRHGVLFHDGTPFTSAAIAPDFARRLAVDGGPAYQVMGIASVQTPNPYEAVITLDQPNTAFLDFLASPYGPVMESPTALAANKGSDNDQTYLETHDIGTGPYTLTEAKVGVMYQMKAFPQYWGPKPYYTTINMPVIDNLSTEEIEFNDGQLAAILHDMTTSVINQYRTSSKVKLYNLPTLESETAYLNENKGFLTSRTARIDLIEAIDAKALVAGVFPGGRATVATQAGPTGLLPPQYGKQDFPYDPSKLKALVKTLPASERSFTVGYDTGAPDDQLLAEDIGAELQALGLNTKVIGLQTSVIYADVGSVSAAQSPSLPNVLIDYFWPDTYNAYTWTHINFDPTGGLEYMSCNVPGEAALDQQALTTGSDTIYNEVVQKAENSGCWFNIADKDDTMVAQPWLKGIPDAHNVAQPEMLELANLRPG